MNKLIIIGNVVRDPELKTTSSGISVCVFTVAVNNKDKADFFRCTAWRQLAEVTQKYLKKGGKVAVVGSVALNTYKANDGQNKANLEVNCDTVEFLSSKDEQKRDNVDERSGFVKVDESDNELPF